MRRTSLPDLLLVAAIFLATVCCFWSPALAAGAGGQLGVVLLHGKQGSPERYVTYLTSELRLAGFLVSTPEMPWSGRRNFAEGFDAALAEIGAAVHELLAQGATRVVVAGHSLGGNAALAYASRQPGLEAVVCLAAAHTPDRPRQREGFAQDVQLAREMVAAGRGQEKKRFHDVNMGKEYMMLTSAQVYLSYNDPEGPAVMPRSAAALKDPLPILWVVGARDPQNRDKTYAFDHIVAHPHSRFVEVGAEHLGVPTAASGLVIEWLRGLGPAN